MKNIILLNACSPDSTAQKLHSCPAELLHLVQYARRNQREFI